jgi:ribosomal protein L21E
MKARVKALSAIATVVVLALFSVVVFAVPEGPESIERGTSERRTTASSGSLQEAEAGNMTALTINNSAITTRWQGYYGNITGTITLDDAVNNTLYSWAIANPQGEVYAVNDSKTVQWTQLICLNMSDPNTANVNVTLSALENSLGITNANDKEGVNETFNHTFTGSFQVGSSVTIDSTSGCRAVSLNVNNVYDALNFNETILTDNTSNHNVIYTAILEQQQAGFSNANLDFQMIVGEDGDTAGATNYYFYIELS